MIGNLLRMDSSGDILNPGIVLENYGFDEFE